MAAYFIVNLDVKNPKGFRQYSKAAPSIVAKYGGKYIVRGGECNALEGDWKPVMVVLLEFPSMEQARQFYDSEEYKPLLALRKESTVSQVVLVDGV